MNVCITLYNKNTQLSDSALPLLFTRSPLHQALASVRKNRNGYLMIILVNIDKVQ